MMEQTELSPERLARALMTLRDCPQRRLEMSRCAREWAIPDATERVLQVIRSLLPSGFDGTVSSC